MVCGFKKSMAVGDAVLFGDFGKAKVFNFCLDEERRKSESFVCVFFIDGDHRENGRNGQQIDDQIPYITMFSQ